MRGILALALAFLLWPGPGIAAQEWDGVPEPRVKVKLFPSGTRYSPGRPLRVAFVMDVSEGWHTYWVNPGTAGEPARVGWALPADWRAMGLEFPVPKRIQDAELVTFGYEGRVALLDTLVPPPDAPRGPVTLTADLSWLVCKGICLAESASITLVLHHASGRVLTTDADFLDWESRIPRGGDDRANRFRKRWLGGWTLTVRAPEALGEAEFFPANREGFDIARPIRARAKGGFFHFVIPKDRAVPFKDGQIEGLVVPEAPATPYKVSVPLQ